MEDPALNSLSNEPLTHSVLAHDDGAEHLGDVGGAHLDTDLSFFAKSRIAFSPAQRVALTANGNLQRVLSAYHNERVTIRVLSHERESLGLWRRRVVLELADRPACVARSSVVARTRTAIEEASKGGGLGQLFLGIGRQAGVLAPGGGKRRGDVLARLRPLERTFGLPHRGGHAPQPLRGRVPGGARVGPNVCFWTASAAASRRAASVALFVYTR